jgi:hypothetical protein
VSTTLNLTRRNYEINNQTYSETKSKLKSKRNILCHSKQPRQQAVTSNVLTL